MQSTYVRTHVTVSCDLKPDDFILEESEKSMYVEISYKECRKCMNILMSTNKVM